MDDVSESVQKLFDEIDEGPGVISAPATIEHLVDDTEDGIALLFAQNHPEFRWVQQWGKWYCWDGQVWLTDEKLQVFTMVRSLIRIVAAGDEKPSRQLRKATTVAAVERLARCDESLVAVSDQWDADQYLLNTEGGIVNCWTGVLQSMIQPST